MRVWNLNDKFRKLLEPMAAEFGWTAEDFLRRYSRNELPAQAPTAVIGSEDDCTSPQTPKGFTAAAFRSSDKEFWDRIKRAATMAEKAPAVFIWDTVVSAVSTYEEDMVLAPDGRIIGDRGELDFYEVAE